MDLILDVPVRDLSTEQRKAAEFLLGVPIEDDETLTVWKGETSSFRAEVATQE